MVQCQALDGTNPSVTITLSIRINSRTPERQRDGHLYGHLYKDELALARVLEPQEEGTSNQLGAYIVAR